MQNGDHAPTSVRRDDIAEGHGAAELRSATSPPSTPLRACRIAEAVKDDASEANGDAVQVEHAASLM
jgi:hypothetical protein